MTSGTASGIAESTMATFDIGRLIVPIWYLYGGCIVVGVIAWGVFRYWRRSQYVTSTDSEPRSAPVPTIAKGDTPTIRLGDSQRIDRMHRVLTLKAGEHVDILDATFDHIPRLRVALASVEHIDADAHHSTARDCARLRLELGGAIAGCGVLVQETGVNQFLVPRVTTDEQRSSILHFHGKDSVINFLRIKVLQLNIAQQSAEIDVLHVNGHWAG